ncbi:hypothetical protein CI109_105581 [Kwoniella shandongensis]|uniref:Uncharacterized protein n=1 Tax=Kwoniella shandongensis TaxID=1734106 RepID=A0A5M6C7H2_9TREE|nr:uncharacterized protein CI109_002298 [Kwoniella shandongensis]KAA5529405.1 hypothetical protein CI109_002298 [Kwoniella shandongensis]
MSAPQPIQTSESTLTSSAPGHGPSAGAAPTSSGLGTTHAQAGLSTSPAAPPSVVAQGTNLPSAPKDLNEPQQAATAPGTGGVVEQSTTEKIPFKEQVNGYAKKFAGTVFRNSEEKEFGEKKLDGQI